MRAKRSKAKALALKYLGAERLAELQRLHGRGWPAPAMDEVSATIRAELSRRQGAKRPD